MAEHDKPRDASARKQCATNVDLDFSTFIVSIGTTALVGLGLAANPENGQTGVDLDMAKQNIDILAVLCDKTHGNLSEAEDKLLQNLLYDLRLAYVRVKGKG